MLSSFASFLPSALQLNGNNHDNHATTGPSKPTNPETVQEHRQPVEGDTNAKKGAATKARSVNETFIVVRPPPAKSNHPLNLQVQLVPPASRAARQSFDEVATTTSLTRTASNRSDTSTYGSTASFSSTGSTASMRRTIIPLYNLHAHNVMTNTIVDAGTDAKIARFQKRGIELIDLAFLEPVEVWGESRGGKTSRPATPDFVPTADSSATSLQYQSAFQTPPHSPAALPPKRNIFGKLFKKSGKDSTPPPSPHGSAFPTNSPTPTQSRLTKSPSVLPTPTRGHTRNLSATLSPSTITSKFKNRSSSPNAPLGLTITEDTASINSSNAEHSTSGVGVNPNPSSDEKVLRPPILGIQPAMSYSYTPSPNGATPGPIPSWSLSKNARALMYVWFVRKWLKRKDRPSFMGNMMDHDGSGGVFGMMRGSMITQGSPPVSPVPLEAVEVRFEWRRMGGKGKARRGRLNPKRSRGSLFVPGAEEDDDERTEGEREADRKRSNRLSVISHQSISTNVSVSEEGSPRREKGGRVRGGSQTRDRDRRMSRDGRDVDVDAGEDSDPEDTETPWVCTLKIRRAGTPAAMSAQPHTPQGNGGWSPSDVGTPMSSRTIDGREMGALSPQSQPQVLRFKVGTLSPTPHHPKLVAMLKVPFPLPDVEVEQMGIRKRSMGQRLPQSSWGGTTLTAEEIKDVVCSTAMWLVVREGFGGIGKVTRRGDGWRIRA